MKIRFSLYFLPAMAMAVLAMGCATDDPGEADPEVQVIRDITEAAPGMVSVVFENDHVRATLVRLEPGDELPPHAGDARAVYSLTDYRILWTEAGESAERAWEEGQAHWHDALDHAVRNIGQTEAVFLVVARTGTALPEAPGLQAEHDAAAVEGGFGDLVFENDHVRITEVTLPPGASQPTHQGVNRLVYSLSDYTVRYTSDRMDTVEATFADGDAHWHEADEHSVENIGDTEARFVLFQFKR